MLIVVLVFKVVIPASRPWCGASDYYYYYQSSTLVAATVIAVIVMI